MTNMIHTKRTSRQFRRRMLLKTLSVIGAAAIAGGWGISRTRLMWQINEYVALALLGGKAQSVVAPSPSMDHSMMAQRLNSLFYTSAFCSEQALTRRIEIQWAIYNFIQPHRSLRVELPVPILCPNNHLYQRYRKRTPAMAAGLAHRVLTMEDLPLQHSRMCPQY